VTQCGVRVGVDCSIPPTTDLFLCTEEEVYVERKGELCLVWFVWS